MHIKCVLVGDGAVGKMCMVSTFIDNSFPDEYVPTVLYDTTINITVDNIEVLLNLWVTAGQEDYDRLRPLTYPGTDVFLLCFALNYKNSAENVQGKWMPELDVHDPKVPIVLVGTKLDIRQNKEEHTNSPEFTSRSEGERIARKIKAVKYLECSSLTREGLKEVFEEVVRAAVHRKKGHSRHACVVL